MASKGQMTGILGTYLTAADLTHRGVTLSLTSRNARGADLLGADQSYKRTWSLQVKTKRKPATFWLLRVRASHGPRALRDRASHLDVLHWQLAPTLSKASANVAWTLRSVAEAARFSHHCSLG